jgi:TolB protein
MTRLSRPILALFLLLPILLLRPAAAQLTIEITRGVDSGIPIAVVPFEWSGSSELPQPIADIVEANLVRSGRFDAKERADFLETPTTTPRSVTGTGAC